MALATPAAAAHVQSRVLGPGAWRRGGRRSSTLPTCPLSTTAACRKSTSQPPAALLLLQVAAKRPRVGNAVATASASNIGAVAAAAAAATSVREAAEVRHKESKRLLKMARQAEQLAAAALAQVQGQAQAQAGGYGVAAATAVVAGNASAAKKDRGKHMQPGRQQGGGDGPPAMPAAARTGGTWVEAAQTTQLPPAAGVGTVAEQYQYAAGLAAGLQQAMQQVQQPLQPRLLPQQRPPPPPQEPPPQQDAPPPDVIKAVAVAGQLQGQHSGGNAAGLQQKGQMHQEAARPLPLQQPVLPLPLQQPAACGSGAGSAGGAAVPLALAPAPLPGLDVVLPAAGLVGAGPAAANIAGLGSNGGVGDSQQLLQQLQQQLHQQQQQNQVVAGAASLPLNMEAALAPLPFVQHPWLLPSEGHDFGLAQAPNMLQQGGGGGDTGGIGGGGGGGDGRTSSLPGGRVPRVRAAERGLNSGTAGGVRGAAGGGAGRPGAAQGATEQAGAKRRRQKTTAEKKRLVGLRQPPEGLADEHYEVLHSLWHHPLSALFLLHCQLT